MVAITDFNEKQSIKVNCNFCNKEMECPEDMLKTAKKQMCFECFNTKNYPDKELQDVHVDMPLNDMHDLVSSQMADKMVDNIFPELWQEHKESLKEKSKKDLAEEMFGAGVYLGVKSFLEKVKDEEKNEKTDRK